MSVVHGNWLEVSVIMAIAWGYRAWRGQSTERVNDARDFARMFLIWTVIDVVWWYFEQHAIVGWR